MAGAARPSHGDWLQFETLVRFNLPAHISQVLYRSPSKLTRTDYEHRQEVEDYLLTIEKLRHQNEDMQTRLESKEAELSRLQGTLHSGRNGLLVKLAEADAALKGTVTEGDKALGRDLETARLKAQTNEETIVNLERMLKKYKERIRYLEILLREKNIPTENHPEESRPIRYRDRSLDLSPLLEQAEEVDLDLANIAKASESSLLTLANKLNPLPEDLVAKLEELKQRRASLQSEVYSGKSYRPQEIAEKLSILLSNSSAKEGLLRQHEGVKRDLLSRWYEWQLAALLAAQKEEVHVALSNAKVTANEHNVSEENKKELEDLEKTASDLSMSPAPALEQAHSLQLKLLEIAKLHNRLLAPVSELAPGHWDSEQLLSSQERAADQSEDTFEALLHISGRPKDELHSLKSKRSKLKSSGRPSAMADLQIEHEQAKRNVLDQASVRMQQLTEQDQEAQQRLRHVLEQSEISLATLADLAAREPGTVSKLAEERSGAQTLGELIALEEAHQTLRTQFLKDIPHVMITAGVLKDVLTAVKTLRQDLKVKLGTAQQRPALEELGKSDHTETEAVEALETLFKIDSKEGRERALYAVLDRVQELLTKQKEVQGAGFVSVETTSKVELTATWQKLLTTIDELVNLLAESYHKLTIDDPETRPELESILDDKKLLNPDEPNFSAGFDFSLEIIAAVKKMLSDTNNLTDIIGQIREVDENLLNFQKTMQDNYYKLKPVVGTEEVPGRRGGDRRTTFLHIRYAEPRNPKEGINILSEMISTLKKNTDNLFEIENKRVGLVEKSLNIKRASDGLQLLKEIVEETQVLRTEDLQVLGTSPEVVEEAQEVAKLTGEGLEPLEQIPNYSESITYFLKNVTPWLEKSREFDRALNRLIKKVGSESTPQPKAEKPTLKGQRAKVRSGRSGGSDPMDIVRSQLSKLLTDTSTLIAQVKGPEELQEQLRNAATGFKEDQPIISLVEKHDVLDAGIAYLLEHLPQSSQELQASGSLEEENVITTELKEETVVSSESVSSAKVLQLQKDLDRSKRLVAELQEELTDLRKFKADAEDRDERIYALEKKLKAANSEVLDLKGKLDALSTENKRLAAEKFDLEKSKTVSLGSEQESKSLRDIIAQHESRLKDREAQHAKIVESLQAIEKAKIDQISALNKEKQELETQVSEVRNRVRIQLQKRMILSLGTTIKFEKAASLLSWKLKTLKKYQPGAILPPINWTFSSVIADPSLDSDQNSANAYLSEESRVNVESGLLTRQFIESDGRLEKPVGLTSALETMAEAVARKIELDREELGSGRRPAPFPEFFIDYLTKKYGMKHEAVTQCNKLLLTLQRLHKQRHGFSTFYVRLLSVFHNAPLPYPLSISLLQLAQGFSSLADNCASVRATKKVTQADVIQTGGEAYLFPVMELVLNLFDGQPQVSRLVLQGLTPERVDVKEFLVLKLAFGLKKANITSDALFGANAETDQAMFSTGLAAALPAVFSQKDGKTVFEALTATPTLSKQVAAKTISALNFEDLRTNERLVLPMSTYLLALADSFHYLLRDHLSTVQSLLQSFAWKTVTLPNFQELATAAGISVAPEVTESWYNEAKGGQPNLTPEAATRLLLKYPVHIKPPLVPAELSTALLLSALIETTTTKTVVTTKTTVAKKIKIAKIGKK